MIRRLTARRETLLLVLILMAGAALRLYGLNWDAGHWLHPDERQIYFVAGDLAWPDSLAQALSPDSPLNPHFFAYGSLPIYLVRLVAALLGAFWPTLRQSGNLHLAGRPLAVLFDLGTVYLTYRLVLKLSDRADRERCALFAAALVSLAVIHVQLAHFYTVDPVLTFFVMLTLNLAADVIQGGGLRQQAALGLALGLALATKVSAAPLVVAVLVAYDTRRRGTSAEPWLPDLVRRVALTLLVAVAVFFLTQPYALIDWKTFLEHTFRESEIARGARDVPYTLQYTGTLPFLYSVWQTALWGLALPVGLLAWLALAATLVRWLRRASWTDALLLAWAGLYFAATGLLHTRYLRYMLPLAPVLCILAVRLLAELQSRWLRVLGYWLLGMGSLVYVLAFSAIYTQPHPWIVASEWIYREVPAGGVLSVEHWDMALPLPLEMEGRSRRQSEYDLRVLALYDEPDDAVKWGALAADGSMGLAATLASSDYLIVASRRLYGSIPRAPDRYPVASRYYEQLLSGDLGFELVREYGRGPAWLNPRLSPLPDAAPTWLVPDESFVVYDHPRALIFRNAERLPAHELLKRLGVLE